ncbi:hypothetical protein ACWC3X_44920, partial [Streptomyces populi]
QFIPRALARARALKPEHVRTRHLCDILSAGACYRAARGDHAAASRLQNEIAARLVSPTPEPAVHLSELSRWYSDHDDHLRALRQARTDSDSLEQAGLREMAMRSEWLVGDSALRAYTKSGDRRHLDTFVESSQRMGRLQPRQPNTDPRLREALDWAREQTKSLRQQLASQGKYRRALRAHQALTSWPDSSGSGSGESPGGADWDLLEYALHPQNLAAIRALTAAGALRREATVRIAADHTVTIDVTTIRDEVTGPGSLTAVPSLVYGCLPLPDAPPPQPGIAYVAGAAIQTLRPGAPATLHTMTHPVPPRDGSGNRLYRAVWGSTVIPHRVDIHLAPGLVPGLVECAPRSGYEPRTTIHFGADGCHLTLGPPDGAAPWLADVAVVFRVSADVGALLARPGSPFTHEMSFSQYSLLLGLLTGDR